MIGVACETYQNYRVEMPDPDMLPRVWKEWFNAMDRELLYVCKKGG